MIINKSSWHYRLLRAMDCRIPRSLCPYFWKTVFMTFIASLLSAGAIFFSVLVLYGWGFIWITGPGSQVDIIEQFMVLTPLQHILCVVYSIIIDSVSIVSILGAGYLISSTIRRDVHGFVYEKLPRDKRDFDYYDQYSYNKRKEKPKKSPGLIRSFIKARKDKICPVLEFKD